MLLEMTMCDGRDTFTNSHGVAAGSHTSRRTPRANRSPRRKGAHEPEHGKWLVGLRTPTTDLRNVWLFYVVHRAFDADHAVSLALARANSVPELATRNGARLSGGHVEVHEIHQDALGRLFLVRSL
ncbi:hypothetical protein [Actinacidiphila glaucinigra]|uniref:hypothetical protein n=1 Tax=Actinacidiphila glaucinigra TaxID=235986 RepID=UPI002E344C1C|nr:hypothetical protein [Actinacidiphila glaucinigra]